MTSTLVDAEHICSIQFINAQSYRWKLKLCASEVDQFNFVLSFFSQLAI